jgi:IS30 family transposase
MIRNRVSIDQRPDIVAHKSRIDDWEDDTMIGKDHQGGLLTLAERKSRYVLVWHIRSKHAKRVTTVATRLLKPYQNRCHPISVDNGKEFSGHENLAAALQAEIYFAHPYRSWVRVLKENSNGLLRQHFPKGIALTKIRQDQVQYAVDRLNHRLRKVLDFKTTYEIFFGKTVRYTKSTLNVALRN